MAVPQFLASAFRYLNLVGVVDVQTIIDGLYTELIANGWTCTVGGTGQTPTTMVSPVRADRVRLTLTFERSSATRLDLYAYDDNGIWINDAGASVYYITIDAAPTDVELYTSALHCCINSRKSVAATSWNCAVLDNAPSASLAEPYPFYYCSGGPDSSATLWMYVFVRAPGDAAYNTSSYCYGRQPYGGTTNNFRFKTMSGANMFCPFELCKDGWMLGRVPHMLMTDYGIAPGTDLTVPLDTGVTGTFRVLGFVPYNTYAHSLCMRKA
jgi:hypothetical protein